MLFTKVAAIVQNAAYQDMRTWMLSTRILFKVTVQQNTRSRWQFAQIALHHNSIHKCAVQRRTSATHIIPTRPSSRIKAATSTVDINFSSSFLAKHTSSASRASSYAPAEIAPMASDNQQAPAPRKAPLAEMSIRTLAQSSARSPTIASLAKKPKKALTLKEQRALYTAKAKAAGNNTEPSIRTVKVPVPKTSKPALNRSTISTSTAPKSNTRNPSSNKVATKPTTNRLKSTTKSNSTIFRPASNKKPTIKEKRETYEMTEKASHLKAAVIVGKPGEWARTWQKHTSFLDGYVKAKLESKSTTSPPADVKKKPLTLKEQRTAYAAKGKVIADVILEVAAPKTTTTFTAMKENVRPSSSMSSRSPKNHSSADKSSVPKSDSGIAQKENIRRVSSNKSPSKNRPTAKQSSDHHSTTAAPVVKNKAPTLKPQLKIHEATEKTSHLKAAVIVGEPGQHAQIWGPRSSTSPESSSKIDDSDIASLDPKKKALTLKEQMARYAARRASDSASASPNTDDTEEAPAGSRRTSASSSSSRDRAKSPTREPSSSPRSRSRSPTLPPLVRKPLTAKEKLALHAARREAAIAAKEKAAAMSGSSRRASADSAVSSASNNNIPGPAPMTNMIAQIAPVADMDITPAAGSSTTTKTVTSHKTSTTSTSKENVPFNNNINSSYEDDFHKTQAQGPLRKKRSHEEFSEDDENENENVLQDRDTDYSNNRTTKRAKRN
ncbi:hypothetical protein B0T09DRAFT_399740 [Sordaria sp. MPI-SDFR-AT-0083]|nr:hypothetical protein B0T09DRAFT_399740 [Sordaria sp. MPI-SDFR-AT-0083]